MTHPNTLAARPARPLRRIRTGAALLLLAAPFAGLAQGVSIGTPNPASSLEVNGGLPLAETTSPALTRANLPYTIPANISQVRLVAGSTAPTDTTLSSTVPVRHQVLTVYNDTAIPANAPAPQALLL